MKKVENSLAARAGRGKPLKIGWTSERQKLTHTPLSQVRTPVFNGWTIYGYLWIRWIPMDMDTVGWGGWAKRKKKMFNKK